ncbi:MAG: DUF1302 family protein [Candidatus Aminicenantaceae bacterium]
MRSPRLLLCLLLALSGFLSAQGLFEEATQEKEGLIEALDLGGYLRSTLYAGEAPSPDTGQIKSGYGEFSLKAKAAVEDFGGAFAELRFREGLEFDQHVSQFTLREAYVDAYAGRFDFRVGHQIVVWGRADGLNPTDNITPRDMLARSPDEDDRRMANFLIRTYYNASPVRLEGIWIPFYRPSRIPTEFISFPANVIYGGQVYPAARLEDSAFAVKLNLELPSLDGSLSYFNGHNPFPGMSAELLPVFLPENPVPLVNAFLKSYRMQVIGADFATTLGSWGLRGEAAYRWPYEDYKAFLYIINPDLYYVVGIDREFPGNLSLIFQYLGRYVIDFEELNPPQDPSLLPLYRLAEKNRLLASQQYELSHAFTLRIAKSLMYETLELELMGYVNLTSEEFFIKPRVTYRITDALKLIAGGEWYQGPSDTLFDLMDPYLSAFFGELRLSF